MAAFVIKDLKFLIRRWIRAFHAALYGHALATETRFAIQAPFPSGDLSGEELVEEPISDIHIKTVELIKKNRAAGNLDRICTNQGKLEYECVWDKLGDGSWTCFFALDVYDWKRLGDSNNFEERGCVGLYTPPHGTKPSNGTVATRLEFNVPNLDPVDPFAT